ncbi:MAG: 16S rRNA (cytosine(1402)-N(4))-methyltransferase RsmH [Planctomycetes bacterium]|nr:16S rRNA (cytosine(1402)-N(4))-methyltransferase RsmH [Planctomycetota bacterium]MCA8937843.1 16S rRNA (cytosine(1402)-N(4))-methyltransferase RsmH [Planctomycetota bacterium]
MAEHLPVLVSAVVKAFGELRPGATIVDGTCGFGGHSAALLERYPGANVVGFDRDTEAVAHATQRLAGYGRRAVVRHGRFGKWLEQLRALGVDHAGGLLLDVGVSSYQLDRPERGFSFREAGPVDMRMDPGGGPSALEFLQGAPEDEIARVIWRYGDERLSRRIARQIKRALDEDRLSTTLDLAEICRRAYPKGQHRIDPATRTFQALRIHVNDELGELENALASVPEGMEEAGIIAVISFHSLEDRIVKQTMREWQEQSFGRILKPAPITADEPERVSNPRARSAKLRVFVWGAEDAKPTGADRYRSKKHRQGT